MSEHQDYRSDLYQVNTVHDILTRDQSAQAADAVDALISSSAVQNFFSKYADTIGNTGLAWANIDTALMENGNALARNLWEITLRPETFSQQQSVETSAEEQAL